MTRRPTAALGALAVAVVALVSLPVVYLVVRVADGGSRAWSVLERPGTLESVGMTVGMVAAVTAVAVVIGLPSAWLVTRTDLPGRRIFAVMLALPLVVPSYVLALALIAVSGPSGLLGVPAIDGFDGSVAALALATYPYVFLLCAASLRRSDRSQEEAARSLGASPAPASAPARRAALGVRHRRRCAPPGRARASAPRGPGRARSAPRARARAARRASGRTASGTAGTPRGSARRSA